MASSSLTEVWSNEVPSAPPPPVAARVAAAPPSAPPEIEQEPLTPTTPPRESADVHMARRHDHILMGSGIVLLCVLFNYLDRLHSRIRTLELLLNQSR